MPKRIFVHIRVLQCIAICSVASSLLTVHENELDPHAVLKDRSSTGGNEIEATVHGLLAAQGVEPEDGVSFSSAGAGVNSEGDRKLSCASISSCKTFNTDCSCASCSSTYTYISSAKKCCKTLSNCSGYDSITCACAGCNNGYTFSSDVKKCCKNVANCTTYDPSCACTACNALSSLTAGKCVCSPIVGSVLDSTTCAVKGCSTGYTYLSDVKKCCKNVTNCCAYDKDTCACAGCSSGYSFSSDSKKCCKNVINCGTYDKDTCACTSCKSPWTLSGGKCATSPKPTASPTSTPTVAPTPVPTPQPSVKPTEVPTPAPTVTDPPTNAPTATDPPTNAPTATDPPTNAPTSTDSPTDAPTRAPITTILCNHDEVVGNNECVCSAPSYQVPSSLVRDAHVCSNPGPRDVLCAPGQTLDPVGRTRPTSASCTCAVESIVTDANDNIVCGAPSPTPAPTQPPVLCNHDEIVGTNGCVCNAPSVQVASSIVRGVFLCSNPGPRDVLCAPNQIVDPVGRTRPTSASCTCASTSLVSDNNNNIICAAPSPTPAPTAISVPCNHDEIVGTNGCVCSAPSIQVASTLVSRAFLCSNPGPRDVLCTAGQTLDPVGRTRPTSASCTCPNPLIADTSDNIVCGASGILCNHDEIVGTNGCVCNAPSFQISSTLVPRAFLCANPSAPLDPVCAAGDIVEPVGLTRPTSPSCICSLIRSLFADRNDNLVCGGSTTGGTPCDHGEVIRTCTCTYPSQALPAPDGSNVCANPGPSDTVCVPTTVVDAIGTSPTQGSCTCNDILATDSTYTVFCVDASSFACALFAISSDGSCTCDSPGFTYSRGTYSECVYPAIDGALQCVDGEVITDTSANPFRASCICAPDDIHINGSGQHQCKYPLCYHLEQTGARGPRSCLCNSPGVTLSYGDVPLDFCSYPPSSTNTNPAICAAGERVLRVRGDFYAGSCLCEDTSQLIVQIDYTQGFEFYITCG